MAARAIFLGAEGNRIVGDRRGEGDRLALFLHGGGQTRHAWKGAAVELARRGLVTVAIDQRGHGESQWVESGRYRYADFAADLVAVARETTGWTGRAPVAVGASLGGIASFIAEAGAPGLFSAVVLVDIVPNMDPEGVRKIQDFMKADMERGFGSLDEAADAVAAYQPHRQRPASHDGLAKNLRLDPDGRWRWHWDPRFMEGPFPVEGQSEETEAMLSAAAARLACPVLLVRGALSDLVTPERAEAFRAIVPHAGIVDVGGAAHMVAGDRNDVFTAAIEDFVAAAGRP